jgi:hypothetical protein
MNTHKINAQELSSRKLWQLAQTSSTDGLSAAELSEVIAELAKRCQDMDKLEQISKLEPASKD